MNIEKQKAFIIHVLYISIIGSMLYIFLRYAISYILPFLIGFAIAFFLRPIIKFLTSWTHGHEKFWSILIILIFYTLIGVFFIFISLKGFSLVQEFVSAIPLLYKQQIEPFLHNSLSNVESVWKTLDITPAQAIQSILNGIQNAMSTMVTSLSGSVIHVLTNFASSLPNIILSFFIAILSSFFFNADYQTIITFFTRFLSYQNQQILFSIRYFITNTIGKLIVAYTKLMIITFVELSIGLSIIGIDKAILIALAITLFDILPILGTGGIIIPWIFISFLNHQIKLSVGLIIIYIIVTMVRTILEPKIVGKQIGLHPLAMLLCIYLGAKLFGFLGIFLFPMIILIVHDLNKNGSIRFYSITNKNP